MDTHTNAKLLQTCSDELERLVLEEVHKRRPDSASVSALVVPGGRGELALELAGCGCRVTGADEPAYESEFNGRALAAGLRDQTVFCPIAGLAAMAEDLPGQPFDIVYCRRGLCHIPYAEARQVLRGLFRKLRIGGKLYISILGLHSELGDAYPDRDQPVEHRFSGLDPAMATKYGIDQPVCLYSERNLFMLLLEAGGSVLRTFTSTHGSVKGVAVRV